MYNTDKLSSNRPVQTYSAHGYEVLGIAVTSDNARFASVGGDKTVFIWDVAQASTIRRFSGHAGRINAVDWNANGNVVITGRFDGGSLTFSSKSIVA